MTSGGRARRFVHRSFGHFHRDARLILVTSLVAGAAISLWWIDFNLYLRALGYETATIGLVSTLGSLGRRPHRLPGLRGVRPVRAAGRVPRRPRRALSRSRPCSRARRCRSIILSAALWAIGNQTFQVVVSPYLTEHSEPEHRNELFAIQFAIQNVTNIVAAILGGVVATAIAARSASQPGGPGTYRIILVIMTILLVAALVTVPAPEPTTARRGPSPRGSAARRARRVPLGPAPLADDPRASRSATGSGSRSWSSRVPHLDRRGAGHPVPEPLRPGEVRARPRPAQRRVRAHLAGDGRRDPAPAAARPAVRADHLGRHRPGRVDPVPHRPRVLARSCGP